MTTNGWVLFWESWDSRGFCYVRSERCAKSCHLYFHLLAFFRAEIQTTRPQRDWLCLLPRAPRRGSSTNFPSTRFSEIYIHILENLSIPQRNLSTCRTGIIGEFHFLLILIIWIVGRVQRLKGQRWWAFRHGSHHAGWLTLEILEIII